MAFLSGLLDLGIAQASGACPDPYVVVPPCSAGYAARPISFDSASGGIALNTVNAVFGPVLAPWGALTAFGVRDPAGNGLWVGELAQPVRPAVGSLVYVQIGQIKLNIRSRGMSYAFVQNLPAETYVATGTTQLQAAPMVLSQALVNAGSGGGVLLPKASTFCGNVMPVINRSGGALSVYPYSGDTIETYGVNEPVVIQNDQTAYFRVAQSGLLLLS